MQRILALILLLCFGASAPLQGMPLRWCKLERKILTAGFQVSGETGEARKKCCDHCPAQNAEQEHDSDCCVALGHMRELTIPGNAQQIPVFDFVLAVLPLFERMDCLSPAMRETDLPLPEPIPITGRKRQAVLSIWTV